MATKEIVGWAADVCFVGRGKGGCPVLVLRERSTGAVYTKPLRNMTSQHTTDVTKTIWKNINMDKECELLVTDGGTNFVGLHEEAQESVVCAANEHVGEIEGSIRWIRECTAAIIEDLRPFGSSNRHWNVAMESATRAMNWSARKRPGAEGEAYIIPGEHAQKTGQHPQTNGEYFPGRGCLVRRKNNKNLSTQSRWTKGRVLGRNLQDPHDATNSVHVYENGRLRKVPARDVRLLDNVDEDWARKPADKIREDDDEEELIMDDQSDDEYPEHVPVARAQGPRRPVPQVPCPVDPDAVPDLESDTDSDDDEPSQSIAERVRQRRGAHEAAPAAPAAGMEDAKIQEMERRIAPGGDLEDFVLNILNVEEQKNMPGVKEARMTELDKLHRLGCFEEVSWKTAREVGGAIIPSRWVDRPGKSRLVVQGTRRQDKREVETFAACPSVDVLKVLLSIAAAGDEKKCVIGDVSSTFIHADYPEEEPPVFVMPPKETECERKSKADVNRKVWRVRRALYGLRDSPRRWSHHRDREFLAKGWTIIMESVYYKRLENGDTVWVWMHVDDCVAVGSGTTATTERIKKELLSINLTWGKLDATSKATIVGINFNICIGKDGKGQVLLDQTDHVNKLQKEIEQIYGPQRERRQPMNVTKPKDEAEDLDGDQISYFRSNCGSMIWLTRTRADIGRPISWIAGGMQTPTKHHKDAMLWLAGYLFATSTMQLRLAALDATKDITCIGYSDANWETKSQLGHVIFLSNSEGMDDTDNWAMVCWKSETCKRVAIDVDEAEAIATVGLYKAQMKFVDTLTRMGLHTREVIQKTDSMNVYQLCHKRSNQKIMNKGAAIGLHAIAEKIESRTKSHGDRDEDEEDDVPFHLEHVRTADNLADELTKPLRRSAFAEVFMRS